MTCFASTTRCAVRFRSNGIAYAKRRKAHGNNKGEMCWSNKHKKLSWPHIQLGVCKRLHKASQRKVSSFFSLPSNGIGSWGRWFNFAAAVENIYEHESTIQGDSHVNTCTKSGKSPFIISRKIRTQSKGKWKKLIRSDAGMWKNERKCTSSGCRCAVRSSKCATEAILCYQNVET